MPAFEPFPIADLQAGVYTAKEPWLAPDQAWRTIEDGFVYRGRLMKRGGISLFGTPNPSATETPAPATNQVGTLGSTPVHASESAPSTYAVTFTDDGTGQSVTDDGAGNLVGDVDGGGTNTINYATGDYDFTWASAPTGTVTVAYEFERGLPIMGLIDFVPRTGVSFIVAIDTKRLYAWDTTEERFVDQVEADLFTGGSSDFFDMTPVGDILVITNNVDPVHKYDPLGIGSAPFVVEMDTDFDSGSPGNDIDTAKFTLHHDDRILYFGLVINGQDQPGRVMWTDAFAPDTIDAASFADAPGQEGITSAAIVGGRIVVWLEHRPVELYATKDFRSPYEFRPIPGSRGSASHASTTNFEELAVTVSRQTLVATDGTQVKELQSSIPDFVLDWNQNQLHQSYGVTVDRYRQFWISYVDEAKELPENLLVMSYESFAPAIFNMALSCMGSFRVAQNILWDDLTDPWDETLMTFDEGSARQGFPLIMGGDKTGRVLRLLSGTTDLGEPVTLLARTQRLNPFKMRQAHLGFVDIIGDRNDDVLVTLRFYRDFNPTFYYERTVRMDSAGIGETKAKRRISVNQIASFHTIEIEESSGKSWALDAIIPHFAPVGEIRNV